MSVTFRTTTVNLGYLFHLFFAVIDGSGGTNIIVGGVFYIHFLVGL